eukprot:jgi/Mesvir1/28627/Mv24188-RA.1
MRGPPMRESELQTATTPLHDTSTEEVRQTLLGKLEALAWCLVATGVVYFGDWHRNLVDLIIHDPRISRRPLWLGSVCVVLNLAIFLYLVLWLPRTKREQRDWTVAAPRAIPSATAAGLLATVFFLVALWPIYGLLTPIVLACSKTVPFPPYHGFVCYVVFSLHGIHIFATAFPIISACKSGMKVTMVDEYPCPGGTHRPPCQSFLEIPISMNHVVKRRFNNSSMLISEGIIPGLQRGSPYTVERGYGLEPRFVATLPRTPSMPVGYNGSPIEGSKVGMPVQAQVELKDRYTADGGLVDINQAYWKYKTWLHQQYIVTHNQLPKSFEMDNIPMFFSGNTQKLVQRWVTGYHEESPDATMDRLEVLRDEVPAWTEAEACEKWLKALGPKAAMIPQPRFGCHWDLAQLCTEVHAFNRRQARGLPDLVELVRQEVAQAHKGNRVGGAQSGGGGSSGGRGGPSSRQFGSQADKPASAGGDNTASSSTGQATADPHKACWICGKPDHVKRACPAQCKKEHAAGTPAHAPAGCKYPVVTKTVQAHAAAMVAADSTPTEQAAEVSAAPASPSQPSGQAAGMEAYDAYTLVEQPDLFWAPIHAVEVQAATRGKQARALPSFLPTTGNGSTGGEASLLEHPNPADAEQRRKLPPFLPVDGVIDAPLFSARQVIDGCGQRGITLVHQAAAALQRLGRLLNDGGQLLAGDVGKRGSFGGGCHGFLQLQQLCRRSCRRLRQDLNVALHGRKRLCDVLQLHVNIGRGGWPGDGRRRQLDKFRAARNKTGKPTLALIPMRPFIRSSLHNLAALRVANRGVVVVAELQHACHSGVIVGDNLGINRIGGKS